MYERELHYGRRPAARGSALLRASDRRDAVQDRARQNSFTISTTRFYSASYVRAWAFEVMLREHLKTRFGPQWWTSRRAGDFLKEIWETGDRYTADEMAAQIGIGPISFDLLIEEFNQALK